MNEPEIEETQHADELALWKDTLQSNTIGHYQYYLDIYPVGQFSDEARSVILQLKEEQEHEFWSNIVEQDTQQAYQRYLSEYPHGIFADTAKQKLQQFNQSELINNNQLQSENLESEKPKLLSMSRIGRLHYWNYSWLRIMIVVSLFFIAGLLSGHASLSSLSGPIAIVAFMINIILWFVLGIRRLKDLNQSSWIILWSLLIITVPFLGMYFLFAKGNKLTNSYGKPPQITSFDKFFSILCVIITLFIPIAVITAINSYESYLERTRYSLEESRKRSAELEALLTELDAPENNIENIQAIEAEAVSP